MCSVLKRKKKLKEKKMVKTAADQTAISGAPKNILKY